MPKPFIHLRARSAYSLLQSAIQVKGLTKLAAKLEMPALGLTDTNNLFGALEFSEAAVEAGIQPIIGLALEGKDESGVAGAIADKRAAVLARGAEDLLLCADTGALQGGVDAWLVPFVDFLRGLIKENIPHHGSKYLPIVGGFFFFIMLCNFCGLFFFLQPATSNLNVTFALSITCFLYFNASGIRAPSRPSRDSIRPAARSRSARSCSPPPVLRWCASSSDAATGSSWTSSSTTFPTRWRRPARRRPGWASGCSTCTRRAGAR